MKTVQIHPRDNVAVALEPLSRGAQPEGCPVLREDVPQGHKLALRDIPSGGEIVKYGCVIGFAKEDIPAGAWVHTHNVRTGLSEDGSYAYHHKTYPLPETPPRTFQGYRRPDGRAAVRNELWVLPTVGCVNAVARRIAQENQRLARGGVEGVYAFTHPFGWAATTPRPAGCWRRWPATPTRAACWWWALGAKISPWSSSARSWANGTSGG